MASADRYSGNPFRVLGVPSNTSGKDAGRVADRLLKWIEIGEIPQVEDLLPYLGSLHREREQIRNAAKDVEDPRRRIAAELFWPSSEFSRLDDCQEFLRSGCYSGLVASCEKAIADGSAGLKNGKNSNPQLDACLGNHFLAVYYHSTAISTLQHPAKTNSGEEPLADWDRAFHYWALVIRNETFWEHLADRARQLNDPRVDPVYVQKLRRDLPLALLHVNVLNATASAGREQFEDFCLNCRIIRKAQFGSNQEQALEQATAPLQARFEKSLREIQPRISEGVIRINVPSAPQSYADATGAELDPHKLAAYLGAIEESVNNRLVPIGRCVILAGLDHTDSAREILDSLAFTLRSLSLAFNNLGAMPNVALRLTKAAKEFGRGAECKELLEVDFRTLQLLSLQTEAVQLASASRFKESLERLELARQFASSDEDRQRIDEWAGVARRNLALDGIKEIDSAPSMATVNGIGTKLYGRRNYDPQTKLYVATLYFTFFFFPIFPLACYVVKNAGGGKYQFFGKVPLKGSSFIPTAIIGGLILLSMSLGGAEKSAPTPSYNQPNISTEATTPVQSPSEDKGILGKSIEVDRTRISLEESDLDSRATEIEAERQSLAQAASELLLRALYR